MGMKNSKEKSEQKISFIFLNKYLSGAGACSRRQAAELIKAGQVKVNGVVAKEPWHNVHASDRVELKGKLILPDQKIYLLLNKPKDYVTTLSDQRGRRTVIDLIAGATKKRVYPIGRLDRDTTGLLLITNDGEFTQSLAHPKNDIKKVYSVVLNEMLGLQDLQAIREGVRLRDGLVKVDSVGYIIGKKKNTIKIQLHSGKNRVIRRIFEHFGFKVLKLDRTNYAGLTKRGLALGRWRSLTEREIRVLKDFGLVKPKNSNARNVSGSTRTTKTKTGTRRRTGSQKARSDSRNGRSRSSKTRR